MNVQRLKHVELIGERVILRPVDLSYARTVFDLLHGNDDVLRWLVWDGPNELREVEDFYSRWVTPSENGCDYHFVILDRETEAFVGCIGPRFIGHPNTADVGYWLAPEYWGRGFMTEAVRLVDHLCFRHLGTDVLYAFVFVGNDGSRAVLEKNGYSLIHLSPAKVIKRGKSVDEWYFTLLRHEFERDFADYRPVEESIELE